MFTWPWGQNESVLQSQKFSLASSSSVLGAALRFLCCWYVAHAVPALRAEPQSFIKASKFEFF